MKLGHPFRGAGGKRCIYLHGASDDLYTCGRLEKEHDERNPGGMHEPKPYTGELDWSDLASPFVD